MTRGDTIRALLRKEGNEDGLTVKEISAVTGIREASVHSWVDSMPDVYIDRWKNEVRQGGRRRFSQDYAVYIAVKIPEDMPRPAPKRFVRVAREELHHARTSPLHGDSTSQRDDVASAG